MLLWTRAAPIGTSLPDQSIPVCVTFKIFDNVKLFGRPLDSGAAFTSYDVDFTLKVEAKNLKPDSHYWFQFADCTNSKTVSPVGTTRTISSPNSEGQGAPVVVDTINAGCSSCQLRQRRQAAHARSVQLLSLPRRWELSQVYNLGSSSPATCRLL